MPTCSTRVRRRRSRRSSSMPSSSAFSSSAVAATPASIFMARSISSAAVNSGTLPISLRYMRTGSPVSMVTDVSAERRRTFEERVVTFGRFTSASSAALSSSSGIPSSRSSSESEASIFSSSRDMSAPAREALSTAVLFFLESSVVLALAADTDAILSPQKMGIIAPKIQLINIAYFHMLSLLYFARRHRAAEATDVGPQAAEAGRRPTEIPVRTGQSTDAHPQPYSAPRGRCALRSATSSFCNATTAS